MRHLLSAVVAALACVSPVSAARYIQYDVAATIPGMASNYPRQNWIGHYRVEYSFVIDTSQVMQTETQSSFYTYTSNPYWMITSTATAGNDVLMLRGHLLGGGQEEFTTNLTYEPGTFGSSFPEAGDLQQFVSSRIDYRVSNIRFHGQFWAPVERVWVRSYDEAPMQLGFTLTEYSFTAMGLPEPSTWVMMIISFGLIGAVMRRRRAAVDPSAAFRLG